MNNKLLILLTIIIVIIFNIVFVRYKTSEFSILLIVSSGILAIVVYFGLKYFFNKKNNK